MAFLPSLWGDSPRHVARKMRDPYRSFTRFQNDLDELFENTGGPNESFAPARKKRQRREPSSRTRAKIAGRRPFSN